MSFKNQNIWVIGASSGIGRQLSVDFAQAGANVILSSRRQDALQEVKNNLKPANHHVLAFDISDLSDVKNAIAQIQEKYSNIDRVVILSSIYEPTAIEKIDLEFMSKLIDVNLKGVIYLASLLLPVLKEQERSQLAICASVSGYTGLPNGQPYSASKAGVINFTESLKCESPKNIDVKLINPGFVETPMTDKNDFDMPAKISVEKASSSILKGLNSSRFEIAFPWVFTRILRFISILPQCLKLPITKRFK